MEWKPIEDRTHKGVYRPCADGIHELAAYEDETENGFFTLCLRPKDSSTATATASVKSKDLAEAYDILKPTPPNRTCEYWDAFFNGEHVQDKADMLSAFASI